MDLQKLSLAPNGVLFLVTFWLKGDEVRSEFILQAHKEEVGVKN